MLFGKKSVLFFVYSPIISFGLKLFQWFLAFSGIVKCRTVIQHSWIVQLTGSLSANNRSDRKYKDNQSVFKSLFLIIDCLNSVLRHWKPYFSLNWILIVVIESFSRHSNGSIDIYRHKGRENTFQYAMSQSNQVAFCWVKIFSLDQFEIKSNLPKCHKIYCLVLESPASSGAFWLLPILPERFGIELRYQHHLIHGNEVSWTAHQSNWFCELNCNLRNKFLRIFFCF